MTDYPIIIQDNALAVLGEKIALRKGRQVMVLVDQHTAEVCYPLLEPHLPRHHVCEIRAGEVHKTLDTCKLIWEALTASAFDRNGIVLNLGGGVIGDMGGFVAATYKRGIDFVQVPTTLLSQVDASVGGKLGVDFNDLKNHIGMFAQPQGVYIYPGFLDTLSERELRSGFAEVIKHHLIADLARWKQLRHQKELRQMDFAELIRHSVDVKQRIVDSDPKERGARKALNFGHTVGHAVESFLLRSEAPLLHGEAIAVGMAAETWISYKRGLLQGAEMDEILAYLFDHYGKAELPQEKFKMIARLARNDKKNEGDQILCTLLSAIGSFEVNQAISEEEIVDALEFYSEA
ncbi:MAG: 3-dehydroquinate synthase [Bacteroidota bacterium]